MQPRFLEIHPRTKVKLNCLLRESRADGENRVAQRIQAVLLNNDGRTSGEISSILKSSRSQVSLWLKNYASQGFDGLLEGERSGRPSSLSELDKILLYDIVESGPVAYGLLSGVWNSKMIAGVIKEEFGVAYHHGHVRKILYELGFSVQTPKRVLARADAEKKAKWTKAIYPQIKKKRKRLEAN